METEKEQKKGTRLLIIIFIFILGAVITLIPMNIADDNCFFGYRAICPFAPISTILLLVVALYLNLVRKKQYISK